MNNCLQKITQAPLQYINQLRALSSEQLTMKNTSFYPALPISLIASLLTLYSLSGYIIYYFIIMDTSACFSHIHYGVIILAIVYPIQATIIYISMFGSVAIAKSMCWKLFCIAGFGIGVTGFAFGGIGFQFLCSIGREHPLLINSNFLSSNTFIQVIVYVYLSFFALYLLLIPVLTFSYNQRNKQPNPDPSCCDRFCCIVYYFFQFLFLITAIFMICIKIIGPALLVYVLVEIVRTGYQTSVTDLRVFFALSVLSVFLPFCTFLIAYLIANCACTQKSEQSPTQSSPDKQKPSTSHPTQLSEQFRTTLNNQKQKQKQQLDKQEEYRPSKRNSIFMYDISKNFEDDHFSNAIRNDML